MTYRGFMSGRWQGRVPNIMNLPREESASGVIYANTHRAKILRFDAKKDSAEIEFENTALIPPTMWVPMRDLRNEWGGQIINVEKYCPKCEVPWTETMLARFPVWDCPQCGAKKEDHCLSKP